MNANILYLCVSYAYIFSGVFKNLVNNSNNGNNGDNNNNTDVGFTEITKIRPVLGLLPDTEFDRNMRLPIVKSDPIKEFEPDVVERNYKYNVLQFLQNPNYSQNEKLEHLNKHSIYDDSLFYSSNHKAIALLFMDW